MVSADSTVPDPKNPQSLNRYSYAYNNPVNLSDPSGHAPTDGCHYEGCSLTIEERRESIRTYTNILLEQRGRTNMTDVEIFAQTMDFASDFNTNTQEWADDLTSIVNGTTGVFTLITGIRAGVPNFGDTGFHPVFRDGGNQIYHWWAYANTAVQGGELGANVIGYVGNEIHEFWDIRHGGGNSWQDYALSENGMSYGLSLYYGDVTPEEAGDLMKTWVNTDTRRPAVRVMQSLVPNHNLPANTFHNMLWNIELMLSGE